MLSMEPIKFFYECCLVVAHVLHDRYAVHSDERGVLMTVKSAALAVLIVYGSGLLAYGGRGWPVALDSVDEGSIHKGVMRAISGFAQAYGGDPLAAKAEGVVKGDKPGLAWIGATLGFVAEALDARPPGATNQAIRESILMILDYPLHVDNLLPGADPALVAEWQRAVGEYHQARAGKALLEIVSAKVDEGLMIWKFYNMGFVVKSRHYTIGFDTHPGFYGALTPEQIDMLAGQLDVLFLSHGHEDHIDRDMVEAMLKVGKKVVMPPGINFVKDPTLIRIMHDDYKEAVDIGGIKVRSFPGVQNRTLPCCVYAVTVDGFTISHNGDNERTDIYAEIAKVGAVDVVLGNCWSGLKAYVDATTPKLVITGHENELMHGVSKRESYLRTFRLLRDSGILPKALVLDWGESCRYPLRVE
jgi:hypothetical protein